MIYRKRGTVVRWENGTRVRVTESGVAIEQGDRFECHPDGRQGGFSPPPLELAGLDPAPRSRPERLILIEGYAEHEFGDRRWSEHTRRLHASVTHGSLRALIDQASFDLSEVENIAGAMARAEEEERDPPPHLRVSAAVTAAWLPHLAGAPVENARIVQTAGGVDGDGASIVEATADWPNVFRPSYRVRPVRIPLNLRIECERTDVDPGLPVAVALLEPVEGRAARVLVVDGARVYPSTLRITGVVAVAGTRVWYPYGGGSFGAEMML